jgi:hypothetical protein
MSDSKHKLSQFLPNALPQRPTLERNDWQATSQKKKRAMPKHCPPEGRTFLKK